MKLYTPEILLFLTVALFFVGMGYMIVQDSAQKERLYNVCIQSGKQYIKGTCVN